MKQIISLIACVGKNRELGYKNDLIWKIPEDLEYFKRVTSGHPIIMGLKTYFSIGRPLPDRVNIVLSDDPKFSADGIKVAKSMEEALKIAEATQSNEVFFIGGGFVYSQAIKIADKLYLTLVDDSANADVYFPDYSQFTKVEKIGAGEYKEIAYKYLVFTKNA
jgi:dihydrofolate reductase